jgi:ABC-type branched-subunit amino acid transport system substrate-binding protein
MNLLIRGCFSSLLLCLFLISSTNAQDEIGDLSLEELGHVNIEKKSIGILGNKKADPACIYLGLMIPYSVEKEYALELKNAIDLAIEEINLAGGVLDKKLALAAADDGSFKELAVQYADSLVHRYAIAALIGPTSSTRVIHMANTYLRRNPILIISPSASSEEISSLKDDDLVWRTMPSDEQQTKIAADYILNTLKKKSVGILYAQDAYGKGLYKGFKRNFKGRILSEVVFSPLITLETFDFTEKLNALFKDKPEVIFLAMGGKSGAGITHAIAKGNYISAGYAPVIFGVDAMKVKDFINSCDQKIVEGMYGTGLRNNDSGEFRTRYFAKYNKYATSSDSERAYDIAYILALAMEKANSSHYASIRNELRNITEGGEKISPADFSDGKKKIKEQRDVYFEGASGKINFNSQGDLTSGVFEIWRIVDGKHTTHEIIPVKDPNGQK